MRVWKFKIFFLFLLFSAGIPGCAHYNFKIIVQDGDDQPIPEALVYVESYTQNKAVDFTWVSAGKSIEVPEDEASMIELNGSNESFIAIAVLAEGKKPVVMRDPSGVLKPEMWEYMVEDQHHMGLRWETKISELQFPFIHQYGLKERLKEKENWPLVHAFYRVYEPLGKLVKSKKASRHEIEKYNYFVEKIYKPVCELEKNSKLKKSTDTKSPPEIEVDKNN